MRSLAALPSKSFQRAGILTANAVALIALSAALSWSQATQTNKTSTLETQKITPSQSNHNPKPKTEQVPAQTSEKSSSQDLLKVTIASSRVSVTRDGSYGVYADLENISEDIVTIRSAETVLVVQPEVARPSACVEWEWGIFPAKLTSKDGSQASEMQIRPNEHYKVFWDLTARSLNHNSGTLQNNDSLQTGHSQGSCSAQSQLAEYLGFVPGDYAFTVEGIAYAPGSDKALQAHTYTETTTLRVGISQLSTAIAAFVGALLAYFVVALQPGRDFDSWRSGLAIPAHAKMFFVVLRNMFAAGLLGATVTIVASRLSDTQFPVKVSVNDFWGSLTIGFIAYFIGNRFILNLANRFAPPSPTGGKPATEPQPGGPKAAAPEPQKAKASDANQEMQRTEPATKVF